LTVRQLRRWGQPARPPDPPADEQGEGGHQDPTSTSRVPSSRPKATRNPTSISIGVRLSRIGPHMKLTLERPDPDVVTAVNRSAGLLREGRELLLDLVGRAAVRDAAAALTGRGRLRHRPHGPGGRRRLADPARRLCHLGLAYRKGTRRHHAVRALGTWFGQPASAAVLIFVSDSLDNLKSASDKRGNPRVGG
jgi:hypothetical protein